MKATADRAELAYLREADQVEPTRDDYAGGRTLEIVRAWHDDTHPGTFRLCDQQPCHAINRPAG